MNEWSVILPTVATSIVGSIVIGTVAYISPGLGVLVSPLLPIAVLYIFVSRIFMYVDEQTGQSDGQSQLEGADSPTDTADDGEGTTDG